MTDSTARNRNLGTFDGVFVPTTLTILGVILFTRTGWLVGHLGLGGAVLVLLGAFLVSVTTALSVCSIVSNIRIGAGGAFSLLTRTLGVEAGGSIGVALYLSQTLATVIYIFGFREGWLRIFPQQDSYLVDYLLLGVILFIASLSARTAFRLQYAVLAVVAGSVISVVLGLTQGADLEQIDWFRADGDTGFLKGFSVFFPAVTGILAGVNLSGELKNPRENLLRGLKWSLFVTCLVYLAFATIASVTRDGAALREDFLAVIDIGFYSPVVTAGLLAATFSSALNSLVGAPRILQALGGFRIVPKGEWLAHLGDDGEPKRALFFTSALVALAVLFRDLNAVAPLITLFFLLTYGTINATLWIQQGLQIPQFRPTFRVPLWVPASGTIACMIAMYIVSSSFFFLSWIVVAALYVWLERRAEAGPFGQVRAGVLNGFLRWAVAAQDDDAKPNFWHSHFLVPILDSGGIDRLTPLLSPFAKHGGTVSFLIGDQVDEERFQEHCKTLKQAGLATKFSRLGSAQDLLKAVEHLNVAFLSPNLLIVRLDSQVSEPFDQTFLDELYQRLEQLETGLWFVHAPSDFDATGEKEFPWGGVTIWVDSELPVGAHSSLDLVLLSAWRLSRQEDVTVDFRWVAGEGGREEGETALKELRERSRILNCTASVVEESLLDSLEQADSSHLHFVVKERPHEWHELRKLKAGCPGFLVVACLSGSADAD
jgi:amino acid transporter